MGLFSNSLDASPALKRWAIFDRPSRTDGGTEDLRGATAMWGGCRAESPTYTEMNDIPKPIMNQIEIPTTAMNAV
jgi:hypothetical protein